MANTAPNTIDILIDIRAKLDELTRGQTAMRGLAEDTRDANREANNLGASFKTGLGIEVARRGIELLTGSLRESVAFASRLSDEVERAGVRAGLSGEVYQALGFHLKQAGGSAEELVGAMEFLRRTLGEASDPKSGPAKTLNELGLSFRQLRGLAVEDQFERIARGLARVGDENRRATLTAALLGRGSASLNDLLDQLARRGLGALTSEAQKASGVMSNDMSRAIDEAGDRAEAAREKFEKMLAPFTLGAKERSAAINQLKADLAEALVQNPGKSVLAVGGVAAAAAAGGVALAGGLGSPQAWGFVAGAALARASALAVPAWTAIGTIVAAGVLAAIVESKLLEAGQIRRDTVKDSEQADDERRRSLANSLRDARDPAMVSRVQAEATRRARDLSRRSGEQEDPAERARLEGLSKAYTVIVAQARTQGAEIVKANQALDEQKAILAAIPKTWDQLTEEEQKAAKERGEALAQEAKVAGQQLLINLANVRALREQAEARKLKAEEDAKALATAEREAAITKKSAEVSALNAEAGRISSRADIDAGTKQSKLAEIYERIRKAIAEIVTLKEKELALTAATDPVKRAQIEADIAAARVEAATLGIGDPATGIEGYRERARNRMRGPESISAGDGIEAGALNFVTSLGSQGEQVAAAIQNSLGSAVRSIGDGIYGWITGAQTFGATMRDLAGNVLQTFLQTLVEMGVQWVVNAALAKGSLISTFLVASGLRKAETAEVIAGETAKSPAIMANAAGASVSSFGLAAALGIAALLAVMAAFGGFREHGGPVQPGRAYIVGEKRPEVFVPDVPGSIVPSLDDLAIPAATPARAVQAAPAFSTGAALAAAGGGGSKRERVFAVVDRPTMKQIMREDPEAESVIADVIYRRRGDLFS